MCGRADWMLWTLESAWQLGLIPNESEPALRLFACWCARACLKVLKVHPSAMRVVDIAEAFGKGKASTREMDLAREGASGGAAGAARALSRHIPGASAQLCCYATGDRSAMSAARNASLRHIGAVGDLTVQTAAEKLNWPSDVTALMEAIAPELSALELATLSGQAGALREIVGNPFAGKLALKRRPRDETGVPLLPDIASSAPDELYDIRLSESYRPGAPQDIDAEVQRISKLLVECYGWRVPEHGIESAYAEFAAAKRAILQAGDFDPVLDAASVCAYEVVERQLFGITLQVN